MAQDPRQLQEMQRIMREKGMGDTRKAGEMGKFRRQPDWLYLTPLIFAPTLPLIRIVFRKQPVLRDRLFFGGIALGLMHGAWLIGRSYDLADERKEAAKKKRVAQMKEAAAEAESGAGTQKSDQGWIDRE